MIGVYRWGWGDESENIAFWGWVENLLARGDAPAAIVRSEFKPSTVLCNKARMVVLDNARTRSIFGEPKVKASTGAVTGKAVFSGSGVKTVKWTGSCSTGRVDRVPLKVTGGLYKAKSTRDEPAVKSTCRKDSAKAVKK